MTFFRDVSPGGALRGFAEQWNGNPYRWRVLALAIATTSLIMWIGIPETEIGRPDGYDVTFVQTFEDGRSEAEIVASNEANQEVQDERRALEEERAQFRRDAYEAIGRASGLDVDSMKQEIAKDEAAQKAAEEKRREEVLARAREAEQADAVDGN